MNREPTLDRTPPAVPSELCGGMNQRGFGIRRLPSAVKAVVKPPTVPSEPPHPPTRYHEPP